MSSDGSTENGSDSSVTDGSMTCSMKTPSPGWAASATNASPSGPDSSDPPELAGPTWLPSGLTWLSAMSEPPPLLPSSTTDSAPRRRSSATAVRTSVTQLSCRQSVSLLT